MAKTYYSDVTKLLTQGGFEFARSGKGSHEMWQSRLSGKKVIVPRNLKSRHTANAILKSAGIDKRL
ncbi:MAG: type II toxin-antitoxin system HicA family toxin [Pseudomonadota bacterium]